VYECVIREFRQVLFSLMTFLTLTYTLLLACYWQAGHWQSWQNMKNCIYPQNVPLKWMAIKNVNFRNPRWWTATILNIENSWSHDDAELSSLSAVCHLGFLKLNFLTVVAHVLHHIAKFYGDRSYCCRDITIFHVFLLGFKNSLNHA